MPQQSGLWLAPGVELERARDWQRDFATWFDDKTLQLPGTPPGRLALIDSPLGPLVAKRERAKSLKRWLSWAHLRQPHGLRAFEVGRAMHERGLPCAEPLAYVQTRGPAPHVDGALICSHVAAPQALEFLESESAPQASLEPLLAALAGGIAELHAAGFRHRDLKAPNLLVEQTTAAAALKVIFLDLEAARGPERITIQMAQRDLARLVSSLMTPRAAALGIRQAHWQALLRLYLNNSSLHTKQLNSFITECEQWAKRHIQRNQRRSRPIS
jgi:tRNA A-37 threonylcarbamoyl transferase component Bud32